MRQKHIPLRCMAYRSGDLYVAECLSLCLIARGNSIDEAKHNLHEQIVDYVNEAASEPEYARSLLYRRAPLSSWAKYYLGVVLNTLFSKKVKKSANSIGIYDDTCAA